MSRGLSPRANALGVVPDITHHVPFGPVTFEMTLPSPCRISTTVVWRGRAAAAIPFASLAIGDCVAATLPCDLLVSLSISLAMLFNNAASGNKVLAVAPIAGSVCTAAGGDGGNSLVAPSSSPTFCCGCGVATTGDGGGSRTFGRFFSGVFCIFGKISGLTTVIGPSAFNGKNTNWIWFLSGVAAKIGACNDWRARYPAIARCKATTNTITPVRGLADSDNRFILLTLFKAKPLRITVTILLLKE